MERIVFASNNQGKVNEVKKMLGDNVCSLKDIGVNIEILEDGKTFEDNARLKAHAIYDLCSYPVLADDSGLMIDSLDGWPGVYTNRFLGDEATDEEKNNFILDKVNGKDRTCRFVCTLVYYDGKRELVANGEIVGSIANESRGENGFGFDPIFETESGKTLGELTTSEKNTMSSRYLALKNLKSML